MGFKRCVHLCFSSRPFTAQTPVPDDLTQSPLDAKTTLHKAKRPPHEILVLDENRDEISDLIFHTTDFVITPIVDNPKVKYSNTSTLRPPSVETS